MRILAWCLMPNHWHLLLWPQGDGDLSSYMRLVTLTHSQRWHAYRGSAGTGHLYQGRFKSFVVQSDAHFLTVCRYVEANALRAKLVARAEEWRWSSLWRTCRGRTDTPPPIHQWPVRRPGDWIDYVNRETTTDDLARVRGSAQRGTPFGQETWVAQRVRELALECTLRPRGRPEKGPDPFSLP